VLVESLKCLEAMRVLLKAESNKEVLRVLLEAVRVLVKSRS
jgi:hypothetical protein